MRTPTLICIKGVGKPLLHPRPQLKAIWWYKPDSHKFVAWKTCAWKRKWQSLYLFSVSHRAGEIWGQVSNFWCLVHAREFGLHDPGNFSFGIQNPWNICLWNQGMWKYKQLEWGNKASGIQSVESRIQDCFGFPYMGKVVCQP